MGIQHQLWVRRWVTRFRFFPLPTAIMLAVLVGGLNASGSESTANSDANSPHAVQLSSCRLAGVSQRARCGTLEVLENPNRPGGRKVRLSMAIIPATGKHPERDPIAVLMGGPGEDAISAAAIYARQFAPLRRDRDILLLDQRGTGRSGALPCTLYSTQHPEASLRDEFPVSAVETCERTLAQQADLTQYTYNRFANDLERVRRDLGYGPLNLFAGSYGTRAAQVYLRMYPDSVRTVYMGSVVPIDVPGPLPFAKTEEAALGRMFHACTSDPSCHSAFPHLRDEFRQISARLASGSVRVAVPGHGGTLPLSRGRVAEWFRSLLYRPRSSTDLPWLIHRAYLGDWSPIVHGILSDAREGDSDISFGLFFSITCSEDIPFIKAGRVAAETQGTFLGDYRVRQQQAACKYWPKALLPKSYREPVRSSVPTVFASGDTDGGTPLWYMRHTAPGFSHRLEVILRGQGHTEWNDCVARIYQQVVLSGSVGSNRTLFCPEIPRPTFKTRQAAGTGQRF